MSTPPAPTGSGRSRSAPLAAAMSAVLALSIWAGVTAFGYGLMQDFEPGPGLFPFAAAVLAAMFAASILAAAVLAEVRAPIEAPIAANRGRWMIYGAVVVGWPLLLQPAGYVVSSALALLLLLRAGEGLSWSRTLLFTAITLAASWALFERLLGVGLPKGLLVLACATPLS